MAKGIDLDLSRYNPESAESFKAWFKARIDQIHQKVSAYDVLSRHGVELRRHGKQSEQISCPFHGTDKKPSAKYHPDEPDNASHVWCWVCRENWDCIKLWQKFTGIEKFSEALYDMEQHYGLTRPEGGPRGDTNRIDPMREDLDRVLAACEAIINRDRDLLGMEAVLKLGSALDKIHLVLGVGMLPLETLKVRAELVLAKIGEKIRAQTAKNSSP